MSVSVRDIVKSVRRHPTFDFEFKHKKQTMLLQWVIFLFLLGSCEISGREVYTPGDELKSHITSPLPYKAILAHYYGLAYSSIPTNDALKLLPKAFSWGNVSGISYLTHNLNQHITQCKFIFHSPLLVCDKSNASIQTADPAGRIPRRVHWQIESRLRAMPLERTLIFQFSSY